MEKQTYTMRELTNEIGMSAPWVRRIEAMRLVKPLSPKGQGTRRVYSHGDVMNMLRLMALSTVGYTPQQMKEYAGLVRRFNKLTEPFLKKGRVRPPGDAVFLFSPRDIFPEGDPDNIDWAKLEHVNKRSDVYQREIDRGELLAEALHLLFWIAQKALEASGAIKKAKRALQSVEGIEKEIDERFLPVIKRPFFSPDKFEMGFAGQGVAYQLRESFKILEEKAMKGK